MMTAMIRPATSVDRPALVALALAEDVDSSGASAVSADEAGELIDSCGLGMIFERAGGVAGSSA
jgi:hypothetical protein